MTTTNKNNTSGLINTFIKQEDKLKILPNLSGRQRAKFEHSIDIDHLYFSSKIEGSDLTKKQIDQAVYGTEI